MSSEAAAAGARLSPFEQLRRGREILKREGRTLAELADRLDSRFCDAVGYLYRCRGSVIVSGMGKAGLVGQKIMATRKISELPVVDGDGRPVGLVDVTDVMGMFPERDSRQESTAPPNYRIYREP